MNRSRDIRVVRTQTALLNALEELLKTKKLSSITITELCSEARINRNTFYYHYNNIIEFLEDNKNMVIEELNQISNINTTHNKQSLIDILKVIKCHPAFMNVLISPNCDLDIFNDIFNTASEKARVSIDNPSGITAKRDLIICNYCNAGCNAVICSWIMSGMKESPEEIADIISLVSRKGAITLLFPEE